MRQTGPPAHGSAARGRRCRRRAAVGSRRPAPMQYFRSFRRARLVGASNAVVCDARGDVGLRPQPARRQDGRADVGVRTDLRSVAPARRSKSCSRSSPSSTPCRATTAPFCFEPPAFRRWPARCSARRRCDDDVYLSTHDRRLCEPLAAVFRCQRDLSRRRAVSPSALHDRRVRLPGDSDLRRSRRRPARRSGRTSPIIVYAALPMISKMSRNSWPQLLPLAVAEIAEREIEPVTDAARRSFSPERSRCGHAAGRVHKKPTFSTRVATTSPAARCATRSMLSRSTNMNSSSTRSPRRRRNCRPSAPNSLQTAHGIFPVDAGPVRHLPL